MQASISNFRNMEVENKMLILGDMRELGKDGPKEHQKIADFLAECGFKDVMLDSYKNGYCFSPVINL